MKMSKFGYFAEFVLFPPLVILAALIGLHRPMPPPPLACVAVFVAGLVAWTLLEYLLHRGLFHHAPILSAIHARHHESPNDLIGTPAWASVLIAVIAVASPAWAMLGFDFGTAATAGLVCGYLWYVLVHYAAHHWQPRPGSYLYRTRMRHAQHHHQSEQGNFGVTTSLWDHVFGTTLEAPSARRPRR
jgi:sterol desaturase/sphingolipid hydroxylase (fatty acid hydroxylase superfamily)